jgi:hypothetical protein
VGVVGGSAAGDNTGRITSYIEAASRISQHCFQTSELGQVARLVLGIKVSHT